MKVSDIEIPHEEERGFIYRFFEILPGAVSYFVLIFPFALSFYSPNLAAYFLILYVLVWFSKSLAISFRVFQGYRRMLKARELDWPKLLSDLDKPNEALGEYSGTKGLLKIHRENLQHVSTRDESLKLCSDEIYHAVIIATYNESDDIIHPTIEEVIASKGISTKKNTIFILAYEERAGEDKKRRSLDTVNKYSEHFYYSFATEHVLQDDEIIGKGGNATLAGRELATWVEKEGIDPSKVLVTVLDSDNRPDENYFASLTYSYIIADDRKYKSYQPIAVYTNNIWDVPALMRISAVNNSFFHTANSMRLHALRNFSAHSQSLDALIDADFWSVRTIVEDGHQFFRMYFRYDGNHEVIPIYAPIYQDAVLASTYKDTLIAQFKQIRRWTYGASDVAYVATRAFFIKNEVPKIDAIFKFFRLLENHVTWATSSLLLVVAAWVPLLIVSSPDESIVALQLPSVMLRINVIGVVVILASMYIGFATLPPRPKHHKRTRTLAFLLQWFLLPVMGVVFNSFAAYYSQTRLMLGKYYGEFDVTEKAVKKQT